MLASWKMLVKPSYESHMTCSCGTVWVKKFESVRLYLVDDPNVDDGRAARWTGPDGDASAAALVDNKRS